MTPFAGQVAVVTGASSGIGRATVLALAASGATVCLISRSLPALEKVAAEAGGGARCRCFAADLGQRAEVERLGSDLARDLPDIDILIHNAGAISLGDLAKQSAEDFDRQYEVNVRAPFVLTQALLPQLKAKQGQIVFVNSTAALRSGAKSGQYAATKASVRALADSLRDEVNGDGIRVLSVFVGRTATPMQAAVHRFEGKEYRPELLMQPEDVAALIVNALALARSAEITEISVRPMRKT